jgi:hypothetical protein
VRSAGPVLLRRHRGSRVGVDHGTVLARPAPAFCGPVHPLFPGHLQEASLGEQGDLAVHGHLGYVWHAGAQLRGGEFPDAGQGVHDAQPDGVQEQVGGVR